MERILITGGSGFIGRAIQKQWPSDEFTVYSRDEYKQDLCKQKFPDATYVIGDVRDVDRLTLAMLGMDIVIHAAAMKYIPEAEHNVGECVSINIDGSKAVLKAARLARVPKVIGISTDKACLPVNTYGLTKSVMERLFDEASHHLDVSCVRYGNVVGSTGSVIPVFERQLLSLGHIQVTNPYMTRYWISASKAVALIESAVAANPGDIVIPKPSAMSIGDLAKMFDPEYVEIGVRPGEKPHENLLHIQESPRALDHGSHYRLRRVGLIGDNEQFTLSSGNPTHWLSEADMREMMEEAKCV